MRQNADWNAFDAERMQPKARKDNTSPSREVQAKYAAFVLGMYLLTNEFRNTSHEVPLSIEFRCIFGVAFLHFFIASKELMRNFNASRGRDSPYGTSHLTLDRLATSIINYTHKRASNGRQE